MNIGDSESSVEEHSSTKRPMYETKVSHANSTDNEFRAIVRETDFILSAHKQWNNLSEQQKVNSDEGYTIISSTAAALERVGEKLSVWGESGTSLQKTAYKIMNSPNLTKNDREDLIYLF